MEGMEVEEGFLKPIGRSCWQVSLILFLSFSLFFSHSRFGRPVRIHYRQDQYEDSFRSGRAEEAHPGPPSWLPPLPLPLPLPLPAPRCW